MTSGQKCRHLQGCFFLQNGITEKYFEKGGEGTTQFIKVETCLQEIPHLVTSRISYFYSAHEQQTGSSETQRQSI